MSKPKNTKELYEYVRGVEARAGNFKIAAGTVWNLQQLAEEVERHNTHNELIKFEVDNRNPHSKEQWDYRIYYFSGFESLDD